MMRYGSDAFSHSIIVPIVNTCVIISENWFGQQCQLLNASCPLLRYNTPPTVSKFV